MEKSDQIARAQAYLNLLMGHMLEGTISDVPAHIMSHDFFKQSHITG